MSKHRRGAQLAMVQCGNEASPGETFRTKDSVAVWALRSPDEERARRRHGGEGAGATTKSRQKRIRGKESRYFPEESAGR